MTTRTDPLAATKCERNRWVVSECAVIISESFTPECFGKGMALCTPHDLMGITEPTKRVVSSEL